MSLFSTFRNCLLSLLILIIGLVSSVTSTFAQDVGDIITVKALDFQSTTRDTMIQFPDLPGVTYEKIMLKYTMRCKDGLVSTGTERNKGCGEWDYSCNTYLVDSSKIEEFPQAISDNYITNNSEDFFEYSNDPVYDLYRTQLRQDVVQTTSNEVSAIVGVENLMVTSALATEKTAGKSQYLYQASDLLAAGLSAGELDALALTVLSNAGEARYLRVKLKETSESDLSAAVELDGFEEVYADYTVLTAGQSNRLQFHTPFMWDGSSNLLVEFNFSNLGVISDGTSLAGSSVSSTQGISTANEQQLYLTNNSYVEIDGYKGIGGDQNRTIEAWVRTSASGTNGEIASWGLNAASRKYTFRFTNGVLRVENGNGGTVATTAVNDGEWHHVACVLNGDNLTDITFYLDGVLDPNSAVGTTVINTESGPSGFNLRVSRGVNNRYIDGEIDDVRIWDTNLSAATINAWKNFRLTSDHPNYNNLQLYYPFEGSGNVIVDESGKGRDGDVVGSRYTVSVNDGPALFKDFVKENTRLNLTFYQGDYTVMSTVQDVDRIVVRNPRHFLTTRSIVSATPGELVDDEILTTDPVEIFGVFYTIYDEATGNVISEEEVNVDGEIEIDELTYFRRFPFYNELLSFVTPYGIGLDFGQEGKSWYFDMSDYVDILKGDKRLLMTLGGQNQEEMDLEFIYTVGTPPREVVQYDQLWQGTNRIGIANINQIATNQKFPRLSYALDAGAETFIMKSSITGHGSEGEFAQNGGVINHSLGLNNGNLSTWQITQECSGNPIYPQGGTWVYDRQGWCPGERSRLQVLDFSDEVSPGESVIFDYSTSAPPSPSGDYRYHVSHQVVGYGAANFQQDASLVKVIAPNNTAEYTRVGNVCANPQVVLRNSGAATLERATITYWINNASAPQTYEWTGSLEFMEEEVVTIPSPRELWFDILSDNNVFWAEVTSPNGGADAYSNNNVVSASFDYPEIVPRTLELRVRTNSAPSENSYVIYNAADEVIASNLLPAANTTYTEELELGIDCYRLVFLDTGGDGLSWWANAGQGVGSALLRDEFGNSIVIFEPDFGGGFEYSFSTDFAVSAEELAFLSSIELYPNPTSNFASLRLENTEGVAIELVDVLGRVQPVSVVDRSLTSIRLDVSSTAKGVYFVVIRKGDLHTTRKLEIH